MRYLFDAPTHLMHDDRSGPVEPWFEHGRRVAPRSALLNDAVTAAALPSLERAMAVALAARRKAPRTFAERLDAELKAVHRTLRRYAATAEALAASAAAPAPVQPRRIPMAYMTAEELTAGMSPRERQRLAEQGRRMGVGR